MLVQTMPIKRNEGWVGDALKIMATYYVQGIVIGTLSMSLSNAHSNIILQKKLRPRQVHVSIQSHTTGKWPSPALNGHLSTSKVLLKELILLNITASNREV